MAPTPDGPDRPTDAESEPPGAPALVEAVSLTKSFGHTRAVEDVSFSLTRGEILGFLGPNGAGKSTTLRMITGILAPDSGSARVAGIDIEADPLEARRSFGYLPESLPLYWEMQVDEYLRFIAGGRGLKGAAATRRIDEVVELLGLGRMRRRATGALSKGYRQRVGLAQAMLHDPPVLILDEPTNGLDPQQIVEIRGLLRTLAEDRAILFSTHILQEIAAICSRILVIHGGHLIADGTPEMLAASEGTAPWEVVIEGGSPLDEAARAALGVAEPSRHGVDRVYAAGKTTPSTDEAERIARDAGGRLVAVRRARRTLEQTYLQLTGAAVGGGAS